jgi:hypothetical protein
VRCSKGLPLTWDLPQQMHTVLNTDAAHYAETVLSGCTQDCSVDVGIIALLRRSALSPLWWLCAYMLSL